MCASLSRAASVLGGLVFALGGFMGNTDWPQILNGALWLPLVPPAVAGRPDVPPAEGAAAEQVMDAGNEPPALAVILRRLQELFDGTHLAVRFEFRRDETRILQDAIGRA